MRSFKLLSYKQDTPQLEEVCMAQMRGYYSCTCNVYISIYIGHLFRFSRHLAIVYDVTEMYMYIHVGLLH